MRKKPLKICAKAGCNNATRGRHCELHKKERWKSFDRTRESSSARGYDSKWYKFRSYYLNNHPLCVFCSAENKLTEATEVDHIQSLKDRPELKYQEQNLRALCKSCHSKRTIKDQSPHARALEDGSTRNREGLFNL